ALPSFCMAGTLSSLWALGFAAPRMGGPGQLILAAGAAVMGGALWACLYALAAAILRGEQTDAAMALNVSAWALARYALPGLGTSAIAFQGLFMEKAPLLGDLPILGQILFQNVPVSFYLAVLACACAAVALRRTRLGLRLRACGEGPEAVGLSGLSVERIRALGILVSGCLGGLGGFALAASINASPDATWIGQGLLALAVLAAGRRRSLRMLPAALFMGLVQAGAQTGFADQPLPEDLRALLPYAAALLLLAAAARGPENAGPTERIGWLD
ncbi:MAG TPA: hypothetical protein PKE04_14940, partial [Clostridia bacterium]|nr:hypothetical protein [Clostridia bacterium]